MQLKTILNRVEPFKSFVYGTPRWSEQGDRSMIEVPIVARKNGRPICSGCEQMRPGYDRLGQRRFEFVPLWGITVYFLYAMRRVDCPQCGVALQLLQYLPAIRARKIQIKQDQPGPRRVRWVRVLTPAVKEVERVVAVVAPTDGICKSGLLKGAPGRFVVLRAVLN